MLWSAAHFFRNSAKRTQRVGEHSQKSQGRRGKRVIAVLCIAKLHDARPDGAIFEVQQRRFHGVVQSSSQVSASVKMA
jgi:hypothetical protein